MTPYYQHAGITIYHGDCREILPMLPKCDLLLTDPPYGIAYDASHTKYKNGIDRGDAEWDKEPFDPAHLIALDMPTIMWGGNCFSSRLPDRTSWIAWVKIARQDADIRQSDCELAWTNCLGRSRVFQHLWIGAYRESESGMQNYHPTQKPLALMRWCIGLFPKVKSVLDPYCGSGTTLVAAKSMGLTAIGIELHEPYCEIAAKRLSQEVFDFGT
jgi:23S rRNA G2445 N2-methylase RlmL